MIDRALVVGLGSIGKRHLRLLREMLPSADIRVLRHSACSDTIEFANGCFTSLKDACAFAPQISIVANPAPAHINTAKALAMSGSHLLVEKPISADITGVSELIAFCDSNGLQLQVGYNLRFLETLQVFRTAILNSKIGQVQSIRCEIGQYLPSWRPDVDYRNTVSARKSYGGGALLELSHELDMLRWVFGEFTSLSAWTGRVSTLEIDVEDCVMLQISLHDGCAAQVSMDFLRRDTTRVCTAIGEYASLRWDAIANTVSHFDPKNNAWNLLCKANTVRDHSYTKQLEAFLKAIKYGRSDKYAAQGADGLAVLKIIEAAGLSDAQNGSRVLTRN